jgi:lipooligosaccharide transport system permease protein
MSTPAPLRVLEYKLTVYRRVWTSNIVTSFLEPMLYLLAMGLGVGSLIKRNSASGAILNNVPYVAFVAPGLLATTAMMVGSIESMWPVLDGVMWTRQYEAMAATPIDANDIVTAHALWILVRSGIAALAVAAAMALFPDVRSWGLIAAVPAAMLAGLAFAMPCAAWAMTRKRDMSFPVIQRFIITPLFLFGGAFFPLSQLPVVIRWIGYSTPLWHGVQLCRSWTTGASPGTLATLGHIGYLVLWAAVGTLLMRRFTQRRLFA